MRENAQLNSIRFDVFARDAVVNGMAALCSMDMQRKYWTKNIKRRVIYYAARSISTQKVDKSEYQDLKPVFICFIMSEKTDNETGIRQVVLSYKDTHEVFDDLINLYLVYVPTVIARDKEKDNLYLFARFFAIINDKEAMRFCEDYKGNELAEVLVRMYNEAVFDESILEAYSKYPYYTEREYLEDKAAWEHERTELEMKASVNIAKKALKKGLSIRDISELTGLDEELIKRINDNVARPV